MTNWTIEAIGQQHFADERVQLRPLAESDIGALREIAFDPDIWRYFVATVGDAADLGRGRRVLRQQVVGE